MTLKGDLPALKKSDRVTAFVGSEISNWLRKGESDALGPLFPGGVGGDFDPGT